MAKKACSRRIFPISHTPNLLAVSFFDPRFSNLTRRTMRLKLLTLALSLAAVSLPSHGEDLLDAYRQARANDPVLAQADATRLAVRENVPQARALLLPQINAGMSLQQQSLSGSSSLATSGSGHERVRSISASVDQTILNL